MYQNQVQALLDAAVDAVMVIDHHGRVTAFNPSAARLFGYRPDEILGRNVNLLMPEPARGAHDGFLARYLRTGVAHVIDVGREVQARRKDDSQFPAWLSVGRIAGSDPPAFVGFVRDTSLQKEALAQMRRERDRANAYLALFPYVLMTLDHDGRIAAVNEAGCRILSAADHTLLGHDWLEMAITAAERPRVRALLTAMTPTSPRQFIAHVPGPGAHAISCAASPCRTAKVCCVQART